MRLTVSMAVLLLAAWVVPAQEPVKPGAEHAKLKAMEGTWDATIEMMGSTSKGTMTYQMGLGGLWLLETFKGDFGGMTFEGRGMTSYDPHKKKYITVWIDSHSTTPMISEGNYEKEGRMVMKGEMTHDGKAMKLTMTTEMKDMNNMVFTMTSPGPDGKDFPMMKITYKRAQK
jgi:hypothetical protein